MATHPMELIHMDYVRIESGNPDDKLKKDINVLVFTGHFTRYAQEFITLSLTARVVAQTL